MHRSRSLARWETRFTHHSQESFLSAALSSGVHSVAVGRQHLDLLLEDRGSPTTLISFHASLTSRARTVPSLQGQSLAADTGVNLIAVADPTIALGDIDLAWFLGNRGLGKLPPILGPLLKHGSESIGSERVILFGPSGGGYAAINFGRYFPDQIVLAVNPRLIMNAQPIASVSKYLTVAHRAEGATPRKRIRSEFVTEKASSFYPDGLPFDLCIFQNTGDRVYRDHQLAPFLAEMGSDPRLFTRLEWTGQGHKPIPGPLLREIVTELSTGSGQRGAIERAGFDLAI